MKCSCGYQYVFDYTQNKWVSKIDDKECEVELIKISADLGLICCPICGAVYYDLFNIFY